MIKFATFPSSRGAALAAVSLAFSATSLAAAALRPAEITPEQATQAPYRDSGRMSVLQGVDSYIGTASYIRRYTGLTAGHILYSPKTGFSTALHYAAALYIETTDFVIVNSFAALSGYQAAADQNRDSDAAFDQDMGYLIFSKPALNDEWAAWSANPNILSSNGPFLAFGYAAESFPGDELASVQHQTPYFQQLPPAFYGNQAYYTEGGMSGGPVYATLPSGGMTMAAINVAGTGYAQAAFSGARAITPAETPLLLGAEYASGIITGGIIKGPAMVAVGGTAKFKTGLNFIDGPQVANQIAVNYDGDLQLAAVGPHKRAVTITKLKPGKYSVAFPADAPAGTQVTLQLLRAALPPKGQTPLQTLTVTLR